MGKNNRITKLNTKYSTICNIFFLSRIQKFLKIVFGFLLWIWRMELFDDKMMMEYENIGFVISLLIAKFHL